MSNLTQYAFDAGVVRAAAENYRKRTAQRTLKQELLKEKKYDEIDPQDRLVKRVNRLIAHLGQDSPPALKNLPDDIKSAVARGGVESFEVNNSFLERVVGATRDFQSVAFLKIGTRKIHSVGRIVTQLGNGRISYGTGFMVSPHLFLTNLHVLKSAGDAANSKIEFDYELDEYDEPMKVERYGLSPQKFFVNYPNLDFALVAVEVASERGKPITDYGFCPLIKDDGKYTQGLDCLNIIQHPRGEMKQVVIRQNKVVDLLDNYVHYEGDTEEGSSGSGVFNDQWEVIALHHSGVAKTDEQGNLLDVDGNVWNDGDDPARLEWVANEGIRISKIVNYLSTLKLGENEQSFLAGILENSTAETDNQVSVGTGGSPITSTKSEIRRVLLQSTTIKTTDGGDPMAETKGEIELKANAGNTADAGKAAAGNQNERQELIPDAAKSGTISFTVPLHITISLGEPSSSVRSFSPKPQTDVQFDQSEKIEIDPNYASRPGYQRNFLGFDVPLPTLKPTMKQFAAEVAGAAAENPYELKYYHYSVIMNKIRRVAFVSAVNFDPTAPVKYKREQGKEVWATDPRIGSDYQSNESNYADPNVDRGHLSRRADAGWGQTEQEAKLANDDTFHFTNCSQQHAVFNQSTKATQAGLLLWGNLEDHVAGQARANNRRVSVFNGPVLRSSDRKHNGLFIPQEFYKIIVFERDDGKPGAVAFRLSQANLIKNLPFEDFEVGDYKPFQVKVSELETLTGLQFGKLSSYDALEQGSTVESFIEGMSEAVEINRLENIVF